MTGAGEALQAAAIAALQQIDGLGIYEGGPVQAAHPYALAETSFETNWSHKSAAGREVRLAVTIRDLGERPVRLRALIAEAEQAVSGLGAELDEWRVVTLIFQRSRMVREPKGSWAGVIEFRARMLASE